ncbi:MAG: sensor histidine kinase [Nostocaceae cyanobacterium]|nr:sensor histidine kinase [Nostocaceae cyanobacterium]
MNNSIQFHNHPFRFLLYLEWILLTLSALASFLPFSLPHFSSRFPEVTILILAIFGFMGLRLPTGNKSTKIIYTIIEFILIISTIFWGGRVARSFPFLYLILVTRSCLIFDVLGRLRIALISFLLFLTTLILRLPHIKLPPHVQERLGFFIFSFAFIFGLALVFILLMMNTALSERTSRKKLAIANEKLRQYALKIENQATLEERNRIAREIHDSLGHSLTALNLQLETAMKLWQSHPEKAQGFMKKAKELGSQALKEVRESVSTMRSHPLQHQSLKQAILELVEIVQRSTGVLPLCEINISHPLPLEISTAIYRIIQESFTNICKHAQATEIKLEITTSTKILYLIIEDNGKGFDITQNTTGFGLQSMDDRTLALSGKFNINSSPGSGCKITVKIPLITS